MAPKMEPKSKKKGIKNKSDFKTKLEVCPGVKRTRNVALDPPPPGAPPYARPVNQKNNRTQDPGTKNPEPRTKS